MRKSREHSKLVPELRFSEFENDGEWVKSILGTIAKFSKGKGVSKKDIVRDGKLFCIRYGELYTDYNEVIDEVISKTNLPKDELVLSMGNEVIVPSSGETQIDIARASCVLRKGIALGGDLNIIRSKINGVFLSYYLNGSKKSAIAQMAQGVSVMHLYNSQLENLEIEIPKPEEQQKIANTLTTLDDLIGAENEKLDALKAHKKGLLQQLFPAKGETVPRLRFDEFEGDWEEHSIQNLIDDNWIISHLDGNHGALYPKSEEFSDNGVPYISANDFVNGLVDFSRCKRLPVKRAKLFKKGVAKDGDILFAHNATVGPVAMLKTHLEFVILSTTATYFRCDNNNLLNSFLKFSLSSSYFVKQYIRVMSQSTRNQVPITTQRKFYLVLPKKPKEQEKIANCLSSIDDTIAAQSEKIESLKAHKKGLMQQLFPNPNE